MKKFLFGIIATVFFSFFGIAQEKSPSPLLTVDYFGYLFNQSTVAKDTKILSVSNISEENYTRLTSSMPEKSFQDISLTSNIEMYLKNEKVTIYVIPLKDDKAAISFVEKYNEESLAIFNISANDNGSFTTETLARRRPTKQECKDGASDIQDLGTAFGALILVGCVPCGFAGGAIVGIVSAMKMLC